MSPRTYQDKREVKTLFRLLLAFNFLLVACAERNENSMSKKQSGFLVKVPDITFEKSALIYDHQRSRWTLCDRPFSGYAISYYPDSSVKEKFGVLNGRKQNKFIQWFPDGHVKSVTDYDQGRIHGEKKLWNQDSPHMLIAHFNYQNGKPHGEQKKWYPTGELFKKLNLNMGKEEGLQQAFRKNGDLYANYEAREGRIFGLKKAKLCYGLEDEKMKQQKD